MHVFIAGANGQIGQHLLQEMANSDHEARALIRHPDQGPDLQQLGATETVVGDLEHDCSEAMRGCDAVIFTAGSGLIPDRIKPSMWIRMVLSGWWIPPEPWVSNGSSW